MHRFRIRQVFWIDLNKPEEARLAEQIAELKSKRAFARTVRDGIRLIYDLSQGKTDVLRELFPWVMEQPAPQAPVASQTGLDESTSSLIERLEALIAEREAAQERPESTGGRALKPLKPVAPQPDEDNDTFELEIKQDSSGSSSAHNLIRQLSDMQAQRGAWSRR